MTEFVFQWAGPNGRLYDAAATEPPTPIMAIIGPPGPQGEPGIAGGGIVATLPTVAGVAEGTPLAINLATGVFIAANALIPSRSPVLGLAASTEGPGFPVDGIIGSLTLADWTGVVGSATLTIGVYYLAEGGGLTNVAPFTIGSSVAIVGTAISADTLRIDPLPPVLL